MYQRVMLTSDGSPLARAALPHAVAMAEAAAGATVVLVAAIDSLEELRAEGQSSGWLDLGGGLSDAELDAAMEQQRALATEHLEELRAGLADAGIETVEEHVVIGAAGRAIVQAVADLSCDLVVMATHGRSGPSRALLGSVADHVVRHAACPVLLVRPTSNEGAG
jgi:nucleotide-binding universal stress UspA family protein